jgi:hypothetical protein
LSTAIRRALFAILSGTLATAASAQPAPTSPPSDLVCPGIEENGLLCSNDPMSGNCEQFVTSAAQLGWLYRSQVAERPGSRGSLMTTNWWGCGPDSLADVKALLVRVGTPRALLVLKDEPYASLPGAPPPTLPPGVADPQVQCEDLASPAEQNACIGVRLRAAQAENQRAFDRCRELVPPGLRDDLVSDQASFSKLLPMRCEAEGAGAADPDLADFVRSRCTVKALTENTSGMLAAHPECAAPN